MLVVLVLVVVVVGANAAWLVSQLVVGDSRPINRAWSHHKEEL